MDTINLESTTMRLLIYCWLLGK